MGRGIALVLLVGCGRFGFDARLGSGGDAGDAADAPSSDSGEPTFTAIDVGGEFTCAIFAARAYCWGRNAASELGTGDTAPHPLPTPVALPAGDVRQLTAGNTHACAVLADGSAYCWGSAMLGDGVTTTSATPVRVGLSGVEEISAAYDFTCAIAGGDVYCWGDDSSERLGNGASLGSTPTPGLTLAGPATHVFTGGDHACAVLAAGTAWCWGHNDGPGALGLGTTTPTYAASPAQVVTLASVSAVTIAGYHACAIAGGGAYCWGTGTSGELGNGGTSSTTGPVAVSGFSAGATAIHTGGGPTTADTACAIRDQTLWCWGAGDYGRPGLGDTAQQVVPVMVPGLPGAATAVAVGWYHACAVAGGSAMCWGRGDSGQLGDGGAATSYPPVLVATPM